MATDLDASVQLAEAGLLDASVATDLPLDATLEGALAGDAAAYPEPGRLRGITEAHSAVRARVATSPSLLPLRWSSEIARVAQAYADELARTCALALVHSTPEARMDYGENLAAYSSSSRSLTRAPGSAEETIALWASELACYTYGPFQSGVHERCSAECGKYGGCGHYTQLVWRDTRSVGCGFAECRQGEFWRSYWVCNYDPPGNVLAVSPY